MHCVAACSPSRYKLIQHSTSFRVFIEDAHLTSTVWAGSSSSFLPVLGTTILSWPFSSLASTWLGSTLSGSCRAGMGRQSDWEHHGAAEHALGSSPCLLLKQATGCRAEQWSKSELLQGRVRVPLVCHLGAAAAAEPQPQALQPSKKGGAHRQHRSIGISNASATCSTHSCCQPGRPLQSGGAWCSYMPG